ncbi:MAG: hypothetical protein KatS3mg015_1702 [Fimbriimonadales bacterium]|nr:MAG: hypothetical protein KatS3mg015_1702 [Fimbriimonadales bacterium]
MNASLCSVTLAGTLLAGGLWLATSRGTEAQDPPFNTKMELKGSTVFVESNWNIMGTGGGATDAKASMESGGLTLKLDTENPSNPRIQFKRQFIVGDGVSWAWLRININDVDNVGFYLGLYSLDSDPRNGEPTYAAYFRKDESDTQVDLRTRNNDSGNTEADKFSISDNTPFELVIKMDGSLSTNKVTFYWRSSPTALWNSQEVTASAPADSAGLHFSLMAFNDDLDPPDGLNLVAEVFEAEAPVAGGSSGLGGSATAEAPTWLPVRFITRDRPPMLLEALRMDDPPSPTDVSLKGSMVFDYESAASPGSWDVFRSETSHLFFDEFGLKAYPGGEGPVVVQHKREFTPESGKNAWASFRFRLDHGDEEPTYFGFFSLDDNPFESAPSRMACFETVPQGSGTEKFDLYAVTKSSSGLPTRKLLESDVSKHAIRDCVVKIEGTGRVVFWYKDSQSSTWSEPEEFTSNLPNGAVRYSFAMDSASSAAHILLRVFEFTED